MHPDCTQQQEKLVGRQGMITVLFEKNFRGVRPAMMNLKNEYQEIIHTSFSSPMAGDLALEIILVRGEDTRLKALERELMGKRGIRSARLTLIPS
jgi:metal-responsive CopG/Arc/MetJ family transcriptional regulator